MDNLTHALIGLTVNNTLPKKDRVTLLTSLLASELPDIDIIYSLQGGTSYLLNHRGITHSVPAIFLFAGLLTIIARIIYPKSDSRTVFLLSSGCLSLHVLFDLFTSWGTQFLTPFSNKYFSLDYLSIIDYVIIVTALAFLILPVICRLDRRKAALFAVLTITCYVSFKAVTHSMLIDGLRKTYPNSVKVAVMPDTSPLKWRGIVEFNDHLIKGNINLTDNKILSSVEQVKPINADISLYKNSPELMEVANFFRRPDYAITGDSLVVKDLYRNRQVVFPLDSGKMIVGNGIISRRR